MQERIPESDYQQLQYFVSESDWNAHGVMMDVARRTQDSLSGQPGEQGLLLDECGWEKSGKKSVGVARQYIGGVGKVSNGQVGVFAALTRGSVVGIAHARLYLPQEWTDDAARCRAAGAGGSAGQYKTKPELAAELVAELAGQGVCGEWVGGDALYGNSPTLRRALVGARQAFVLDITPTRGVHLSDPALPPYGGAGPVSIEGVGCLLADEHWRQITHRRGAKGLLVRQAALVKVWLAKSGPEPVSGPFWLLVSRNADGTQVKYSLCHQPDGLVDMEVALGRQMQRYFVERAFQDVKQQLGMHQYQVRSYKAWCHHIALTMMAMHFMLESRIEMHDDLPLLSCSDVKLVLARTLLNKLHTSQGVWEAIENRHRLRQQDLSRRRHHN